MLETTEFKPVVEDRLYIAQAVFANEAPAIIDEIEALPDEYWDRYFIDQDPILIITNPRVDFSPPSGEYEIVSGMLQAERLDVDNRLPNLARLATSSLFGGARRLQILRQEPHAQQDPHVHKTDHGTAWFVHLSPDGRYDYWPDKDKEDNGTEDEAEPLETGVGDVVEVRTQFLHRGHNPSAHTRYNLAISNRLTDLAS